MLAVLTKDLSSIPRAHVGLLRTPVTSALWDPMSSSIFQGHLCTYVQIYSLIYMHNRNKYFSGTSIDVEDIDSLDQSILSNWVSLIMQDPGLARVYLVPF